MKFKRFGENIQIVACNAPSTKWLKCQFIFKIDSPTHSELLDVRIFIALFLMTALLKRLIHLQSQPKYNIPNSKFILAGISGKKKLQCLNNFEVGFANHVMEMANLSNLLPSACFQAVTIIPTKVYRNSPLLMLLSHHSMVAPSRDLSRFLNPERRMRHGGSSNKLM